MNKNWDEIRGKANQEQNVPIKTFTHDGTQYALIGDPDRAHSHFHEARAHLGKMKRMNVNNLPIISGERSYDDGTITTFKIVHGKEDVHIISPMAQLEISPVKEPEEEIVEVEQIVPVIRSVDNTHWVVCMSGTFEGPYYHFSNVFEIPAAAFDDNIEIDLDGQLISIGEDEYDGSVSPPELYFIAQTGVSPEADDCEWETVVDADEPRYTELSVGEKKAFYVLSGTCCVTGYPTGWGNPNGAKACYIMSPPPYSFTKQHHNIFKVFGSPAALPDASLIETGNIFSINATGCTDPWDDCATAVGFALDLYDVRVDGVGPSTNYPGIANSTNVVRTTSISEFGFHKSIRLEQDNVDNVAACYRVMEETETSLSSPTVTGGCAEWVSSGYPTESDEFLYSYFFRVGSEVFTIQEPSSDDPVYMQHLFNQVKYYGPDSIAKVTGMMSAVRYEASTFEYYYYGTNSAGDLAGPTQFAATFINPDWTHEIENVIGLEDGIKFRGEIFLALVKYEIEA